MPESISSINALINESSPDLSKKTIEDKIISYLNILHACVRGAADVLSDVDLKLVNVTSDSVLQVEDEDNSQVVTNTGRNDLIFALSDKGKIDVLVGTRDEIVSFLVQFHDAVNIFPDGNILDENKSVETSKEKCLHGILTPDVASAWLRLFEAVVLHRSSFMKEPKSVRHVYSANKRQLANATTRYVKRMIERYGIVKERTEYVKYHDSIYWERYDIPASYDIDRAYIQYSLRTKEYGYASIRTREYGTYNF